MCFLFKQKRRGIKSVGGGVPKGGRGDVYTYNSLYNVREQLHAWHISSSDTSFRTPDKGGGLKIFWLLLFWAILASVHPHLPVLI